MQVHTSYRFDKFVCNINDVEQVKKDRNTPIYFNKNHRTEMKLVPNIIYHLLRQFDALKFVLGVRLHGGYLSNFNFLI